MTKSEYIAALGRELRRRGVQDSGDVIEEYEQHFAFKLADGSTEEEIAARLGSPAALAAQFAQPGTSHGGRGLTAVGLGFAWVFASLLFVLLAAWAVVMAAFTLACAVCAVCLAAGADMGGIIPDMPYLCSVVYAVALAALAVLSAVGTLYYAAFVRQLIRAWMRLSHNVLASARGEATLPPLPVAPRFSPAKARVLRRIALVSLAIFAAGFVLAAVLSMVLAGSVEFWHWFVYAA